LVQQVAVSYLRHGYWFHVTGWIKPGKNREAVDRKLIEKYQIAISERERADRKRRGFANLQYIRYASFFLLLATEGHHAFKQEERNQIRDCRRVPIKFEGYSLSYRHSGLTPRGGGPVKMALVRADRSVDLSSTEIVLLGTRLSPKCRASYERLRPSPLCTLCPDPPPAPDDPPGG
jgi:hypothetical protein